MSKETREEAVKRLGSWNDEMMALEKQSSVESWDWRWRAEQAEAKVASLEAELKELETLVEQARIAVYQVQNNFNSMMLASTKLLKRCHKLLDPALFYYDLDPNPLVRRSQIEERTQAKHDLIRALEIFLQTMASKQGAGKDRDDGTV